MSTLTKVLIVLLSLFAIFLCGTTVTFVGNAGNYKKLLGEETAVKKSLMAENSKLKRQYNEKIALVKELEKDLKGRVQMLEDENSKLSVDLRKTELKSLEYQSRANSWAGVLASFEQTIGNLEQSLNLTQEQLNKARSEGIKDRKELNEITASLYEKMVQLESLEASRRRILEQKTSLEEQMSQFGGVGGISSAPPVTPEFDPMVMSSGLPGELNLKGLVAEVGESLITVSIGAADGIRKGMVLHVTRGDHFICDVIITEVDTNMAAGILDLVQQQPRINDVVSTRL